MEKVVFADDWEKYFADKGLTSFGDIYQYSTGALVNKNTKRNVKRITFDGGSGGKVFYMKRFDRPYLKDMYFALKNYGRMLSQGQLEWENAKLLLQNGIDTYRPVCYGHKLICGVERMSFLVTEELSGECLTDFVCLHWGEMEGAEKERIITELGTFVRKIHRAKVSLPDLYVWHIFVTEKAENGRADRYDFAVIDLHRMSHNVRSSDSQIEDLGRLHHSMRAEYFSDDMKRLLIESYAHAGEIDNVAKLVAKVEKKSQAVSAKRRVMHY